MEGNCVRSERRETGSVQKSFLLLVPPAELSSPKNRRKRVNRKSFSFSCCALISIKWSLRGSSFEMRWSHVASGRG